MEIIVILIVAIATYLTRLMPILLKERIDFEKWGNFLSSSSTAIISSLFIISFINQGELKDIPIGIFSLIAVFLTFVRWKNLGLSVISGVIAYFFISLAFKFTL